MLVGCWELVELAVGSGIGGEDINAGERPVPKPKASVIKSHHRHGDGRIQQPSQFEEGNMESVVLNWRSYMNIWSMYRVARVSPMPNKLTLTQIQALFPNKTNQLQTGKDKKKKKEKKKGRKKKRKIIEDYEWMCDSIHDLNMFIILSLTRNS